ncbi:hypothetical protein CDV31_005129 [Fusarium ambrosium]|uniref:Yeast cell wall synthesis Kre9/Knh1-like N-terminal domain-containing protein n=1 Tax=Fusarium ambrosium TaxID=131363 RepID=A0A428UL61_9HYPO|nr:hypothetical protein CDV31_005129 [Fusarium ambrosium]
MQFTISAAAFLAFAAKAFAQTADFDPIFKPEAWQSVAAGQSFQITWDAPAKYAGQLVTISLIGGDSQNTQVPIKDIATGVSNDAEAYNWAVDASLGDKNVYGLVIKLESNPEVFQYSNPFKIAASEEPASEEPTKAAEATYEAPVYGDDGTATLTAHYGSKTVSVSQVYNAPHTTVVPIEKTLTVPCNETTVPATTFVPIVKTASVPCNGTATATGPAAPPVYTHPSNPPAQSEPVVPVYPSQSAPPAAGTPTPVPVSGAARFGAPVAVVAGLVMAAFAL